VGEVDYLAEHRNVRRKNLFQIMFPVSSVGIFTQDEPLRHYMPYAISVNSIGDVNTLTRQRKKDVFWGGRSGNEGERRAAGRTKLTKP
jgi:hypothetical protein